MRGSALFSVCGKLSVMAVLSGITWVLPPTSPLPLPRTPVAVAQIFPDIFSNPEVLVYLQAESLLGEGFMTEAVALYEVALEQKQAQGDRPGEAELLTNIASGFQLRGHLEQAAVYFQRALGIYLAPDDGITAELAAEMAGRGSVVAHALGSIYQDLGQPETAIAQFEVALTLNRQILDSTAEITNLSALALAHRTLGHPDMAIATLQQAITLAENTFAPYEMPQIYNQLGRLYEEEGEPEAAILAYQGGLASHQALSQSANLPPFSLAPMQVMTLDNLSRLHAMEGNLEKAQSYAQQSTQVIQTVSEAEPWLLPFRSALILTEVGKFYLADQRPVQATDYFSMATAIAGQSTDSYAELNIISMLHSAYMTKGDAASLIPYQERMGAINEAMGISPSNVTKTLAELYQTTGDFPEALAQYQEALTLYQRDQQEYGYGDQTNALAGIHWRMGQIYGLQGEPDAAIRAYETALDLYEQIQLLPGQSWVLENLATLYETQGQPDLAQQSRQEAASLRQVALQNVTMPFED